jgi:(S)-citramalyl-CoA lyase
MFPKALASGADIVCVELEDGIAPKDKAEARARALRLFETPQAEDGVERIVRINSMRERFGIEDVLAILASDTPPPALMMPKVRTPDEVVMLDQLLTERGHPTRLHVIIETNAGLEAAHDIARCLGQDRRAVLRRRRHGRRTGLPQRVGAASPCPVARRARRRMPGST